VLAWESKDQVSFATTEAGGAKVSSAISPAGSSKPKHPIAVRNNRGETLLVWNEGTGWMRGGSLAWQTYDAQGVPLGERGKAGGVPTWGLATAWVGPDGGFTILY
jgi:hypothetical protein